MKMTRLLLGVSGVQAAGMGLLLILHILLSRLMGAQNYGIFIYVMAWLNVAAIFGKFGMDRGVVRLVSHSLSIGDFQRLKAHIFWAAKIVLGFTMIAATGAALLFVVIEGGGPYEVQATGAVGLLVLFLLTWSFLQKGALLAFGSPVVSKIPTEIVRPLVMIVGVVTLAQLTPAITAQTSMWLTFASYLLVVILSQVLLGRAWARRMAQTEPGVDYASPPTLRDFSPFVVISVSHTIMRYTDVLLLGSIAGPEQVAHYAVAARIVTLVAFVQRASSPVVQPLISQSFTLGKMEEIRFTLLKVTALVSLATVTICAVLLLWGRELLSIFGPTYTDGYNILLVLLLGPLTSALAGPNGAILSMTENQGFAARVLWVAAAFNAVGNLLLIPQFGAIGAAAVTSTATILWNVLLVRGCILRVQVNPSILGVLREVSARRRQPKS